MNPLYRELLEDATKPAEPAWQLISRGPFSCIYHCLGALVYFVSCMYYEQVPPFQHTYNVPLFVLLLAALGMMYTASFATPNRILLIRELHCIGTMHILIYFCGYLIASIHPNRCYTHDSDFLINCGLIAVLYGASLFQNILQCNAIESHRNQREKLIARWLPLRDSLSKFLQYPEITNFVVDRIHAKLYSPAFRLIWDLCYRHHLEEIKRNIQCFLLLPDLASLTCDYVA